MKYDYKYDASIELFPGRSLQVITNQEYNW